MADFPETNISFSLLDSKHKKNLESIKIYLEVNGKKHYQYSNLNKKEFHYFMGNSVVIIEEYANKADIRILSSGNISLPFIKHNIEKIFKG